MTAPPLRTRKPTGLPSWPMILLEGVEKAGKSYSAAELSSSKQVGRTFWFDLGEGAGDEYGALPGARYEVVEHNGTYGDFCGQIAAAMAVTTEDGLPNVIVVDSITALWSLLVDEAGASAIARKKGGDVTMDLWNIAKKKWRWVMDRLMAYDGIVVLLARGKEVALVEGGRPVSGRTQWKVEGEKSLAFDATAWVRMVEPRKAELAGIRSLVLRIPEGRSTLPLPGFTLDKLIFEQMGLANATTQRRDYRPATAGDLSPQTTAGGEARPEGEAGTAPPPAADPLTELKHHVVTEGRRLDLVTGNGASLDLAPLLDNYARWSRGETLPLATVEQLAAYLAKLSEAGAEPASAEPDPWAEDPQTASEVEGDDRTDAAGA